MNKVDMVQEFINDGRIEGRIEVGINLLNEGCPIEKASKICKISIEDLKREYEKIKKE